MPQFGDPPNVHIDSVHSRAICEEIGYRLAQSLKQAPGEHPQHRALLDRMRRNEFGPRGPADAPSTVPSPGDVEAARGFFKAIFRTSTPLRGRRF
jgi:hypothetical protein